MTTDELLKCVHPLLVDDDSVVPDMPYWNIGTGFLIRFEGNLYLVTAKHCLKNHKAEPEQVSILTEDGSGNFILFDRIHRGDAEGAQDYEFADYIIMRAKPGSLSPEQLANLVAFDVTGQSVVLPDNENIKE